MKEQCQCERRLRKSVTCMRVVNGLDADSISLTIIICLVIWLSLASY